MILCHGSYVCYRGVGRRRAGRKSILFGENGHLTRELPMDHGSGVYGSGVPQPEEEEEEEEVQYNPAAAPVWPAGPRYS